MDNPSSRIGQFHKKKASRVPRSPGFSFGTIEWSCPGMVMLVKSDNKNCLNPERENPCTKKTRLKTFGAQIELRTYINIVKAR